MSDLAALKADARARAFAARKAAFGAASGDQTTHLRTALAPFAGACLAGYMPIRTEIDPRPAMAAHDGPCAVPVIEAEGAPLRFARWTPDMPLVKGPFGAAIPERLDWLTPDVLIVPLVAWNIDGGRLGYGGGFYDRTLERLRAARPTQAIGFAFEAQRTDHLPLEPTDQPLDMIATEQRLHPVPSSFRS
ncbi:MAG: 5-formyltetrahydrofolate cyclo-ligase [Shimia sp.]